LIATGEGHDFHTLKGALSSALGGIGFEPDTGLALRIADRAVAGSIRRLPRALAGAHEAKDAVYFAEVVIDGWLEAAAPPVRVQALARFPAVERDLSLILPKSTTYAVIEQTLRSARAPHLSVVGLKDIFSDPTGTPWPADRHSVTVTLTFRDEARTLTSDEVDRAVETLRDHARAELGAVFRG
jgi:phenylalanyl-tRNA synthetase beta chain